MAERLVALLRGINVGRNKRVAMADLRSLLTELGYQEPRTLLNSGNAVFGCTPKQARTAAADIRAAIAEQLAVDCAVITRTGSQVAAIVEANPLLDVVTDPAKHLIGFLSGSLAGPVARELEARDFGDDQVRVVGSEAYLWCAAGVLASPLTTTIAWSKLGVEITTRNWSTVLKLAELVNA